MYYIYHIPGVKIGCTNDLVKRMADQGFTNWEILEKYNNIYTASKREIELQKEYKLPIDAVPYWMSVKNRRRFTDEDRAKGVKNRARKQRNLTFEQAQEIRSKFNNERGQQIGLAREYNVTRTTIRRILNNKIYLD